MTCSSCPEKTPKKQDFPWKEAVSQLFFLLDRFCFCSEGAELGGKLQEVWQEDLAH